MISKNNKKVLIAVAIILVVLVGIVLLKQIFDNDSNVQNSAGGAKIENIGPNVELGDIEIETKGSSSSGGLTVCTERCGDGVCQTKDDACVNENLSCICPETLQDCPQDCN